MSRGKLRPVSSIPLTDDVQTMQSSYGPAITHVQSGMKILCEVQYDGQQPRHSILEASAVPYVPITVLEELFMRLDLQVTQVRSPKPTN